MKTNTDKRSLATRYLEYRQRKAPVIRKKQRAASVLLASLFLIGGLWVLWAGFSGLVHGGIWVTVSALCMVGFGAKALLEAWTEFVRPSELTEPEKNPESTKDGSGHE